MDGGLEAIHDALRAFIGMVRRSRAATQNPLSATEIRVKERRRLGCGQRRCRWGIRCRRRRQRRLLLLLLVLLLWLRLMRWLSLLLRTLLLLLLLDFLLRLRLRLVPWIATVDR